MQKNDVYQITEPLFYIANPGYVWPFVIIRSADGERVSFSIADDEQPNIGKNVIRFVQSVFTISRADFEKHFKFIAAAQDPEAVLHEN